MIKEKVILVDCDGVLLDWVYSFTEWMKRHDYVVVDENEYEIHKMYGMERADAKRLVRMFNESAWIRKLPPYLDAIKYVKKLHEEHGYVFHAITSLSNDNYAQHLRTKNLCEMFGPTVFERYIYLDTGADKDEVLKNYEGTECYWVEDKVENANVGLKFGLDSLVMRNNFNWKEETDARFVNNWKDIYEVITG
jgi:FMN phosphatase YigB (HAD superfamily)